MTPRRFGPLLALAGVLAACTGNDTSPVGIDLLPEGTVGTLRRVVATRFEQAVDFAIFPADRAQVDRLTTAHAWPTADDFESRAIFRFPIGTLDSLPAETEFRDPAVRLVFQRRPEEAIVFALHRVTSAWSEEAATWTRRDFGLLWESPGGDFDPAPVARFSVSPPAPDDTTTTARIDSVLVPIPLELFQGWRSGAVPNHGLIVVQETPGKAFDFDSRGFGGSNLLGPSLNVEIQRTPDDPAVFLNVLAEEDVFLALDASPFPADGIVVRGAEPPRRAVLDPILDEVPPGATIASAQLVLTVRAVDLPRDSLVVFAVPLVTEFRGENTIFPSVFFSLGAATIRPTTQAGDTVVFESPALTRQVRRWVASPAANRGFGLRLPEGGATSESLAFGGVQFDGTDAAPEARPRLRIVYVPSALPGEEE